jgi:hypothetical protein
LFKKIHLVTDVIMLEEATIFPWQNWEQFKIDYKCKIVGKTSSTSHLGISSSGNAVVISESAKTSWLCSDGITYTR